MVSTLQAARVRLLPLWALSRSSTGGSSRVEMISGEMELMRNRST